MMAVPIETEPALRLGTPVELFDGGFSTTRARDFDVAPDGRFVTVRHAGGNGGQQELRILLNWKQEIDRVTSAGH